jgi:hypothetical protein
VKRLLNRIRIHHEEGLADIACLGCLFVAFLIGVGVLIGYVIWGK